MSQVVQQFQNQKFRTIFYSLSRTMELTILLSLSLKTLKMLASIHSKLNTLLSHINQITTWVIFKDFP